MNRDHRLLYVRFVFDLRLVATQFVPFTNSHYGEDNAEETEQRDVKYGLCDKDNEEF